MNSIEWLSKLVSYDTTSRHSNLNLIAEIESWLNLNGISSRLTYDATKQKANLFATLPAQDGNQQGGIILSGHTDVVPVDGQIWDTDPFVLTQKDQLLFGRGTADMKGFIAVVLAQIPQFKQLPLKAPLHFAFSYDEEIGCKGAPFLIEDFIQAGIHPEGCIVGEPTEMRPIIAHKGIHLFRCRIKGLAAHSSLTTKGCNAIEYAGPFIARLRDLADQIKREGPFDTYYDVPFTSLSTNLIKGGNAVNTIPAECEILFDMRFLPGEDPEQLIQPLHSYINEDLLPKMQSESPEASITIDSLAHAPGFEGSDQDTIVKKVREITDNPSIQKVAYATEAGLFQKAGISTILCGPGSIQQAHGPNEFIAIEQLLWCEEFLSKLASVE